MDKLCLSKIAEDFCHEQGMVTGETYPNFGSWAFECFNNYREIEPKRYKFVDIEVEGCRK